MTGEKRKPRRGEIWFLRLPTDPPDKAPRPVVVVSLDARNVNERAATVLVVPLTTTQRGAPTHVRLKPGETGLREVSEVRAEDISTVRKESLLPPRTALRQLGDAKLREIARGVVLALGVLPERL